MSSSEFADRIAVVTGAASGIGAAIASALMAEGTRVAAFDRDRPGLDALLRRSGTSIQAHCVDVVDEVAVERAVESVESKWGAIDFLVNAAGVMVEGRITSDELDESAFWRAQAVNLGGVWNVVRAVARRMMQRRRGAVVTVSSNAATTPRLGMSAYCASKAAATMLTRCLGLELAEYGVRCNVISPGSTDTPMLRTMASGSGTMAFVTGDPKTFRTGIPLGRVATADDIAGATLFLLSEGARHITMHDLRIDGGATW